LDIIRKVFQLERKFDKMVYIFLADGFEEIEALTQIDYLRRAGIEIISVGVSGKTIKGAHGIEVVPDITIDKAVLSDELEMVILPGGIPGVPNLASCEKVLEAIEFAFKGGKYIAAICAAPTLLASFGYLEGKNAVCYPCMSDEMCGANYIKKSVVKDGRFITAEAAGASEQFAFEIIASLRGEEAALKVRESICAR
jgi:4-methyl-5(b-hydroxyethyl)-thiazole monophosphate biosynthesis